MTRKLYYEDCHLRQFTATVTGCNPTENGWQITLDATAFYPEGGGQACDLGTLGNIRVLDVREQDDQVIHLCDAPLTVGETVTGILDWDRRFDLMQQHSGEHILSGLVNQKYGFHNAGFHVGKEVMEIDFDGMIPPEDIPLLEEQANRVVWQNLPIHCHIPDPEALAGATYRSKRALPWPVRLVQIPDTDSCACCGVHVARTGEVGLIKILSWTKFHQGVRLELVCGKRAWDYLQQVFFQNRQISQALSAKPLETAGAVKKLQDTLAEEKFRSTGLQKQVFANIAKDYVNQKNVLHFADGLEPGQVRELADAIAQSCSGWAAVFSPREGGYSYCLASREEDLRQLGKAMTTALNGRGGGKPNFQQGTVSADETAIRHFFEQTASHG
ncbi:MAG: alanyl-tRNA editing protein [Oscillospiraceae bacterium]|nr:alanyl-tRNA editing protein [Oscillospiraceae bacterium]